VFSREVVPNNKELEYIQKAAHGDHDAFRHLVLAYETPVLTYLQSILGDWETARDLAQETFIAAFYALPHWQPPELLNHRQSVSQESWQSAHSTMDHPLAPWLYRIATNQALTFLKQQGRHKRAGGPLHTEHHTDLSQMSESAGKPQGSVEAWEDRYVVRELLHEALSQLSEVDEFCIILRFVAGERYAEIAERLGTTKEAVRKRVARGLVVLRSVYKTLDWEK
jgi:RNA polymerase sigma factor (sigma-70 family)